MSINPISNSNKSDSAQLFVPNKRPLYTTLTKVVAVAATLFLLLAGTTAGASPLPAECALLKSNTLPSFPSLPSDCQITRCDPYQYALKNFPSTALFCEPNISCELKAPLPDADTASRKIAKIGLREAVEKMRHRMKIDEIFNGINNWIGNKNGKRYPFIESERPMEEAKKAAEEARACAVMLEENEKIREENLKNALSWTWGGDHGRLLNKAEERTCPAI